MVVVTGEFASNGPKSVIQGKGTGEGNRKRPGGRYEPTRFVGTHWPRAFSNIWAVGGIQTGPMPSAATGQTRAKMWIENVNTHYKTIFPRKTPIYSFPKTRASIRRKSYFHQKKKIFPTGRPRTTESI